MPDRAAPDLRLTPRARRVLAALTGRDTPLTAHQLYVELREAGDRIGRTTVYRALHALTDAGLVHEFRGPGAGSTDEARYRACSRVPHEHLVCAGCGTVRELHLTGLDGALAALREHGFLIADCHVEVHGLCPHCASTTTPRPAPIPALVPAPVQCNSTTLDNGCR